MKRVALAVFLAAVPFLAPAAALADAKDSYRAGLNLLAERRFQEAAEQFQAAIAERPEEKGGSFGRRAYYPHFHLGVALAEQRDCRGALGAWAESERQGEIQKARDESDELVRRKRQCEEQLAKLEEAREEAESALAAARKAAKALDELAGQSALQAAWSEGDPSFADRRQEAAAKLEQAAGKLAAASGEDVAPFQETKTLAQRVASELDAIADDARDRLSELRDAASSARERLYTNATQTRSALSGMEVPDPLPKGLRQRIDEVEALLEQTRQLPENAPAGDVNQLNRRLTDARRRLQQATEGPPDNLTDAVEAFFAGNFETALAALGSEDWSAEPRAAAQACALSAASRHALWVLAGETDGELLTALREGIVTCGELDLPQKTLRKYFSPRFLGFYRQTLDEATAEPAAKADAAADGTATDGS